MPIGLSVCNALEKRLIIIIIIIHSDTLIGYKIITITQPRLTQFKKLLT